MKLYNNNDSNNKSEGFKIRSIIFFLLKVRLKVVFRGYTLKETKIKIRIKPRSLKNFHFITKNKAS